MTEGFLLGAGIGAAIALVLTWLLSRPYRPGCPAVHPEFINNNRCTLPDGHEGPHCVELFPHHLQRLQYWWKG